jgi:D-3-phosphoglycerate dehydrogenase
MASTPPDEVLAALRDAGVEVVPTPLRDDGGGVAPAVAESDVVLSGGARLDRDFFAALRATRLLLRPYVGYDDIDVDAATEHGVLVANVPDAITEDVANQALALILAANRRVVELDRYVRDGGWARHRRRTPEGMIMRRPSAQTLGLIGFGAIGQATARRARPFGYRLVAHDPFIPAAVAEEHEVALLPLDDLLRESDVVSVHVSLNAQTRGLLDAAKLALLKPDAWLVNTSRGPVIDEAALVAALRAGRLGGAALDVFEREPLAPDSPLPAMGNVVLSPHVAGYSEEGVRLLRSRAMEIARQVALGGLPQRHVVVNKGLYDQLAALPELAGVPRA